MTKQVPISILLPSYNHAPYIGQCIESLLHQTWGDFELLILDDGSSDHSFEIIKQYQRMDARIVAWRQDNQGLIATLNTLMARSTGVYISQIDSDDCLMPQRLAWGVEDLQKNPTAAATFTAHVCMDAAGQDTTAPVLIEPKELIGRPLMKYMGVCNCVCACTGFMRRAAILASGGFARPFSLVHDWDRWLRLSLVGDLHWRPDVGARYRKHGANQSLQRASSVAQQITIGESLSLQVLQHYGLGELHKARCHSHLASLYLTQRRIQEAFQHLISKNALQPFLEHESIWFLQCLTLLGHKDAARRFADKLDVQRPLLQPQSIRQLDEVRNVLHHSPATPDARRNPVSSQGQTSAR